MSRATSVAASSERSFATAAESIPGNVSVANVPPPQDRTLYISPRHHLEPDIDIRQVDDIDQTTLNALKWLRDNSERAQYVRTPHGIVLYLAPPLRLSMGDTMWSTRTPRWKVEAALNEVPTSDVMPYVPRLIEHDLARYSQYLELEHQPLLWQMPVNMITAARRIYVERADTQRVNEERRVSRHAKDRRRMNEVHLPGVFTRGTSGTTSSSVTWAFVWALRNGLLPENEHERFEQGFPVLPAAVAALVIERAQCKPESGSWGFLLWRAIFSESVRREAEYQYARAHNSLPTWTSQFSHMAWRRIVGESQHLSFSFAEETTYSTCKELDARFDDARVAFKRTLRYWRWELFDASAIDSMPSLNDCGIPCKFKTMTLQGTSVSDFVKHAHAGPERYTGREEWAKFPDGKLGAPTDERRRSVQRSMTHPARASSAHWHASVKQTIQSLHCLQLQRLRVHNRKVADMDEQPLPRAANEAVGSTSHDQGRCQHDS